MNYTLIFSGASLFCVNHTTSADSLLYPPQPLSQKNEKEIFKIKRSFFAPWQPFCVQVKNVARMRKMCLTFMPYKGFF